ncbi:NAD(P)H-hydrate dehydratase domain (Nnr2) [Fructobacillus fructosus]|uniref:NAD(P)H-hydrate dehydratase n=1 Tax=Fructobacillus fructosus TaxID=1631 RepID=UPI0002195D2B|nr:NAD(P)H-hydrate dehydratase [Fructobacillus fructosus]GAP00650.1 ADP-dependent (S)-NAD(P)H-hydrate dehydratase [Fructobacillus fructosus]CAK1224497.1 NAD(P)H-hydrate dehydratase domain (Nnr2) [Fructobacillus fructosus]
MINLSHELAANVITPRNRDSFKGTYGHVLIVGGNANLGGAVIMNAQAAVQSGAGLVTVATDLTNKTAIHARLPEVMVVDYQSDLTQTIKKADVVLVGSGLGEEIGVLNQVLAHIQPKQTLIIDGSALTMMAEQNLSLPNAKVVLTPHQMEWQRFGEVTIADQAREDANWEALINFKTEPILVLKSSATQVYLKDDMYQLTVGGPYQATGGMGDTLAGMVAGFAAQFQPLGPAVLAAVYCHSAIAENLSKTAYVTLPSTIAAAIPAYMQRLAQESISKDPVDTKQEE